MAVNSLNTNFVKDLIDAVIEDEEKEVVDVYGKELRGDDAVFARGLNTAKQDTVSKLRAIKELLSPQLLDK